jgi:hypothetical protein
VKETPTGPVQAVTAPPTVAAAPRPWVPTLLARLGLDPGLARFALWLFALSRLGFVVLTLAVLALVTHAPLTFSAFVGAWYHRDAVYYGQIAAGGYEAGGHDYRAAFFPLQPLAIHLVAPLVGGNVAFAGLIVANLSYVVALLGIAALVGRDAEAGTARRTMLYLTLFPSALFLFAGYSESLFLALTVWSFVCIRRGWWWQAGTLGLLASMTRQAGVFLVLPFAWEYGSSIGWHLRKLQPSALAIGLIPMGPVLFMLWLWRTVGDPLAFLHVQRHWGRTLAPPWSALHHALLSLPHQGDSVLVLRGAIDLGAVLLIAALIVYGVYRERRMPVGDTLYSSALWLLAICAPSVWWPLLSDARFMLVVFPCFVLLAREARRPWLNVLVLAVFGVLLLLLAEYFVSGNVQII